LLPGSPPPPPRLPHRPAGWDRDRWRYRTRRLNWSLDRPESAFRRAARRPSGQPGQGHGPQLRGRDRYL